MARKGGPVGGAATASAAAALGAVDPTGAVSVPGGGVSVAPAAPVVTPPSGGTGGARGRRRAAGAAARRGPVSTSTAPITRPNGTLYHPRTLGDMTDVDALRIAREAKVPFGLYGPPGTGKLLPLDTPIPTPEGWTTMGDIRPGDMVLGRDGRPTRVTFTSEVDQTPVLYDITFSDGSTVTACADHQWTVTTRRQRVAARSPRRHRRLVANAIEKRQTLLRQLSEQDNLPPRMSAVDLLDLAEAVDDLPWTHSKTLRTFLLRAGIPGVVEVLPVEQVMRRIGANRTSAVRMMTFDTVAALLAMATCKRAPFSWAVRTAADAPECVLTTQQMIDEGVVKVGAGDQRLNFSVRVPSALDLPRRDLPVHPYVLGVWLGDGHVGYNLAASITSADPQIINEIIKAGYDLHGIAIDKRGSRAFEFSFDGLGGDLAAAGITSKRIPIEYLRSSAEQRLALLQGLMDTDGSISRSGSCELTLSDPGLAEDAEELIRTLGIKVARRIGSAGYRDRSGEVVTAKNRHRMVFTTSTPVFRLERKERHVPEFVRSTQQFIYITSITATASRPGKCIQVDNTERLYLCGKSMVPTHNTALVEAAFVSTGFEMLLCTGDTTVDDLVGQWIPDGHGDYMYVRGPLLRSLDRDVPLYVDEICLPDPRVMATIYPLLDGRGWIAVTTDKGTEVLKAGEGWGAGCSWNPDVPGASMSEALLSRFPLKIEVRSDYALARSLGVAEAAVLAAENLATKWDNDQVSWAPQLRELLDFSRIEAKFGTDVAWSNLITAAPEADREIVASAIQTAAAMGAAPEPLRLGAQA